jgi:hypothetical protein
VLAIAVVAAIAIAQRGNSKISSAPPSTRPSSVPAIAEPNTLTREERREGWQLLFDGSTFTGWHATYYKKPVPDGWSIDHGAMVCVGNRTEGILTDHSPLFTDFELTLEYQFEPGSDAFVLYRVLPRGQVSQHAPRFTLCDSRGPRPVDARSPGGAYDFLPPTIAVQVTPNNWNQARFRTVGKHLEHWLNGQKVLDVEVESEPWLRAESTAPFTFEKDFGRAPGGQINLQTFRGRVMFRNVKLRALTSTPSSQPQTH